MSELHNAIKPFFIIPCPHNGKHHSFSGVVFNSSPIPTSIHHNNICPQSGHSDTCQSFLFYCQKLGWSPILIHLGTAHSFPDLHYHHNIIVIFWYFNMIIDMVCVRHSGTCTNNVILAVSIQCSLGHTAVHILALWHFTLRKPNKAWKMFYDIMM
jgi:hypothetical protein